MGHLILKRKAGQIIDVGDWITIEVIEIGFKHVRLGIRAPESVVVHRREVTEVIAKNACNGDENR